MVVARTIIDCTIELVGFYEHIVTADCCLAPSGRYPASLRDERLAAVDVVRRARKCRVAHDVNGQRGDISSWAACPRAAHEYQGAGWPDLAGRASRDLKRKQQVLGEASSRLF
jgi:hypothetical protein